MVKELAISIEDPLLIRLLFSDLIRVYLSEVPNSFRTDQMGQHGDVFPHVLCCSSIGVFLDTLPIFSLAQRTS
jgi:hypothetical protein